MSLSRTLMWIAVLAAVAPASANAGVKLVTRDEPLGRARAANANALAVLGARTAPLTFNMVGLHWKGSGTVWFRTAPEPGRWGEWTPARPEAEDGPDVMSPEAETRAGWKLGNPYWTGPARHIQYRLVGEVARLRVHFVRSDAEAAPVSAARASAPAIIRREQWGADESIVRAPPWYAERLRLAIVHHTAGTNDYSAAQSAAIVRGIQRYHVLANGWNDIGYNFLVDKYGQVFEGRAGGITRPVGGAHAEGFNTGSTGVAVLGTYSTRNISRAARSALVKLISWRLDVAHVDPRSKLTYVSYGSNRFPAGTRVVLRAISGHRDTSYTSCPGSALYGRLGKIALAVAARGLPKLYDPSVSGALGGPVRIRGRLSTALPWTVTIRDPAGAEVARGTGAGTAVDWTWNASRVFFGKYTYSISAPDVRPASGRIPGPPPLALTGLDVVPRTLTPNGDGHGERMKISFSLNISAAVTVSVRDAGGTTVATPVRDKALGAGRSSFTWNGASAAGPLLADGRYTLRVDARSPGQTDAASRRIVVDRTLGFLNITPAAFSPNGDGRQDTTTVGFDLTRPADVRVLIRANGETVDEVGAGRFAAGHVAFAWNGDRPGGRAPEGVYRAVAHATTTLGTRTLSEPLVLDTTRPPVKVVFARYRDGVTSVRFSLGEAASVRVRFADLVVALERDAGMSTVRRRVRAEWVRVVAQDAAGNRKRTGRIPVA